jgi:hypothetical protein
MCWLWQGIETDRTRLEAAYKPDFCPDVDAPTSLDNQLKALDQRLSAVEGGLWASIRRRVGRGVRKLAGAARIGSAR